MKKILLASAVFAALVLSAASCGKAGPDGIEVPLYGKPGAAGVQVPAEEEHQADTAVPAEKTARQDGERFETVIMIEGMEEMVRYEHIRNAALGYEMDYDYGLLKRHTESGRERFISIYDDPADPEDYLELTYSPGDAGTVSVAIGETLSDEYDIITEQSTLDCAGRCIKIDASNAKGGGTPDLLQTVYVIPADDGCRIAAAHYSYEAAESFGRRFSYIANTLAVIDRDGEMALSDEQALSAIKHYCYLSNPELEDIVNAGVYPVYWYVSSSDEHEITVLFRSYTGAQILYHIDRITGDAYALESVPETAPEEVRKKESFNVREYSG